MAQRILEEGEIMGEITQESHFEMLEKLPDGNFKAKYPKVKSKSGVTFDEHLADKANPHGVTKSQVDLGNVVNYGIATKAEAEAGVVDNKYITPLRVKEAIIALGFKATTGSYTGNNTLNRTITTGLDAKVLFIFSHHSGNKPQSAIAFKGIVGGGIGGRDKDFAGMVGATNDFMPLLTSTGFTVSFVNTSYGGLNGSGVTYYWVALT